MAVLSRDDFFERIRQVIGDDTSEESLVTLEDFTDTYNHLEEISSGQEDWKAKYKENDDTWRKKYRDRFFNSENNENDNFIGTDELDEDEDEPLTFEDLFKERED